MKAGKKERNVITGYLQGAGIFKRGIEMPDFHNYFELENGSGDLLFKFRGKEEFANPKKALSWNSKYVGKAAGGIDKNTGYHFVRIMKKPYMTQDVIWMMTMGSIPVGMMVDHINHNRSDNRIENLRLIKKSDNAKNMRMNRLNTSGVCGVSFDKARDKWSAKITVNYKVMPLGRFENFEDACEARRNAEIKYGFHVNHGKKI